MAIFNSYVSLPEGRWVGPERFASLKSSAAGSGMGFFGLGMRGTENHCGNARQPRYAYSNPSKQERSLWYWIYIYINEFTIWGLNGGCHIASVAMQNWWTLFTAIPLMGLWWGYRDRHTNGTVTNNLHERKKNYGDMMRYAYAICIIMYMPNSNLSFKYLMPPGPQPAVFPQQSSSWHDEVRRTMCQAPYDQFFLSECLAHHNFKPTLLRITSPCWRWYTIPRMHACIVFTCIYISYHQSCSFRSC